LFGGSSSSSSSSSYSDSDSSSNSGNSFSYSYSYSNSNNRGLESDESAEAVANEMALIANELGEIVGSGESSYDYSKDEATAVSHATNTSNG
jgi:hypothetical protein